MRRLRGAAAALAIAVAVLAGQAMAEPAGVDDGQQAVAQPASTSLPEAAGVVAGAVLLQAALLGMAFVLFPKMRRRGGVIPSPAVTPAPRR